MIILQCQEMIQESQKHLNFHVVPLHALEEWDLVSGENLHLQDHIHGKVLNHFPTSMR